jgi:TPR repeat protein
MKMRQVIVMDVLLAGAGNHSADAQPDFRRSATAAELAYQPLYHATTEGENPDAVYALVLMFDEEVGIAGDTQRASEWYTPLSYQNLNSD